MGLGEALVEDSGEARLRALGYKQVGVAAQPGPQPLTSSAH